MICNFVTRVAILIAISCELSSVYRTEAEFCSHKFIDDCKVKTVVTQWLITQDIRFQAAGNRKADPTM